MLMADESVSLQPITPEILGEAISLHLRDEQRDLVLANLLRVAYQSNQPPRVPLAIVCNSQLIGMVAYEKDPETETDEICVLMIDRKHDGKIFGRPALHALIERARLESDCSEISLNFIPGQDWSNQLQRTMGFEPDSEDWKGEIVMRLHVKP